MPEPLPSLSSRLADVNSSPVRDILELTQREEVISFAGGLPARTLPAGRRRRLAEIAAEHGLWLIEDDPYGELRYDGEPLAPVGSYTGARDRTVTISSLSKVLAPGLRIGFLRAPEALLRPLAIAKQAADLHMSTVDQLAARASLDAADLDQHIADSARSAAVAATRSWTGSGTRCPRARPSTAPTAACSSGPVCRTATTLPSCS